MTEPAVPVRRTGAGSPRGGEVTEREKSMMYLTVFEQNRQSVSRTSGFCSLVTFSGNERRHSVHVITMYGIPLESFPFRGIQTGADSFSWALARAAAP